MRPLVRELEGLRETIAGPLAAADPRAAAAQMRLFLDLAVGVFERSEIVLDDLGLQRPSLDDVFLSLTGHRAETASDHTDGAEPGAAAPSDPTGKERR